MKNISGLLLVGCSALALAGCGADDISSPGGGSIVINNPTPTPTPTPTSGTVTPAADCPAIGATTQLSNDGTISGPEGTWRVCTLPALVNADTTLPKVPGLLYRLHGRVDVGCDGGFKAPTAATPFTTTTASCAGRSLTADTNVTLTIDPGVILYGETGSEPAWLAVNRGNKIDAQGTATAPIIFTSAANVRGTVNETSAGQWGGVVLMGRGIVTDCTAGGSAATSEADIGKGTCERDTEGSANPAIFGGADNTYNAGTMRYFQIRYSGYVLGSNSELQSLMAEGIGTGTTLEYFQSVNSSDDGAEFFGGAVNFKHYIAVNADDDSIDTDSGVQGKFQYLLLLQREAKGDALMEIDSNNFENQFPRQKSVFANFTGVQPKQNSNSDEAAVLIRGNSDITWVNGVINVPENECLRLNGSGGANGATLTTFASVMTCGATKYMNTGEYAGQTKAQSGFNSGNFGNNDALVSTLTATFVNGANESGVAGYANIKDLGAFFDVTTYIGAVKDAADTWYRGWTCDTATADLGSDKLCTALPVT